MHETEQSRPSDNSWLITTCPSCSKQIKAKREILQSTSSIACPYCQHSLNVENESKYDSGNFKYAKAQKLTETPEKGIRKRKSSKKKQIIGWDLDEEDQREDPNEIITVQDSSGKEVRKIRRRSKKGNSHSKAYKTLTSGSLLLLTGSGVILLGAIIYKGFKTINRDLTVSDNLNDPIFKPVVKDIPTSLTNDERDQCMDIINSFLKNSENTKLAELVVHPELTVPRINEGVYGPGDEEYEGIIASTKIQKGGKHIILLNLKVSNEVRSRTFAFEQTNESIKMNWEVSFGHQLMKVSRFMEKKPNEAQIFRVSLVLGDYYSHFYNSSSLWQCLEVSYPNDETSKTFAYVKRDSPLSEKIMSQLQSIETGLGSTVPRTKTMSVIAKLKFNEQSQESNQVELLEILEDHWY